MLTYQTLIEFVDGLLPEFDEYKQDEEMRENKIIYFTFLAIFIAQHLGDKEITRRAASLINAMAESTDIDIEYILDDFFLNLWSYSQDHKVPLEPLLTQFSPKAKNSYLFTVQFWIEANRTYLGR